MGNYTASGQFNFSIKKNRMSIALLNQTNNHIPQKVKLKLSNIENQFLCGFLMMIIEKEIASELILEQCVLVNFYNKNFKKITLVEETGKFTLTAAQAIALKRMLVYTSMKKDADIFRNKIVSMLHKKIGYF